MDYTMDYTQLNNSTLYLNQLTLYLFDVCLGKGLATLWR